MTIVPVILAGGIGERFWPLSRSSMPKQLLRIISHKTMAEETLSRVTSLCARGTKPLIITGKPMAKKIKTMVSSKYRYDVIVEPVGKNTAPPVALAAAWIQARYGEAAMVVLSADHDIRPKQAFLQAVRAGVDLAKHTDNLVVFGIRPSRPDTGYGYIQMGKKILDTKGVEGFVVKRFIEKPSIEKARSFLDSGKYMWNSGMFIWRTSVILEQFRKYMPELYKLVKTVAAKRFSVDGINRFYQLCEKESIDYGIMENAPNVCAIVGSFCWDDIGSWESMERLYGKNSAGTTVVGKNIYQKDCCGSIVVNKSPLAVATIGLSNAVVVTTGDSVLVIDRSKLPDIKKYITDMKKEGNLPEKLF